MSAALIIETSTADASIAIAGGDGEVIERSFRSDRSHNAALFGPLAGLLGSSPETIRLVLVGSGPGSYSGTRVGIAAAQGVAIARGCPAVAVPSILAVAPAVDGCDCLAIGDARRGTFWTARIRGRRLLDAPALGDEAGLRDAVRAALGGGSQVFSFEETARFPLPDDDLAQVAVLRPDAARLWQAWQAADDEQRLAWSQEVPQPIYLKPPHITAAAKRTPAAGPL
jgi:tRNA threonylcarbamoyladenosine biosynthesis protein TsaB